MSKRNVDVTEEVIEEINVEDGNDPSYQLDPGRPTCYRQNTYMLTSTRGRQPV